MNTMWCLAAGSGGIGQAVHDVSVRFGLNLPLLLSQAVSFCIVALLLHRFAYRPILRALEERRRRIEEGLRNAERIKEELAKTEAARRETLAKAGQDAERILKEAREAAAQLLERESRKAAATASQILEQAKEAGRVEMARMRAELRREMGRLVVEATAKVVGKTLTEEDHRRLIEEAVREIAD